MPALTLYACKRLHARLTLASCEANRAKRDIMQAQCEWKEPSVRPWACRDCTDWQAWNSNNAVEVDVSNPEKKKSFVCPECGVETLHFSKGLCKRCYQRQNRREKKKEQAAAVPAPAIEPQALPTPVTPAKVRRVYLAAPYTSSDTSIMDQRRAAVTSAANILIRQGYNVFSPISHGAEVGKGLPPEFTFWGESCLSFVKHWATDVYVLMLPGWEASVGVSAEVEAAKALNIPVTHILPLAV